MQTARPLCGCQAPRVWRTLQQTGSKLPGQLRSMLSAQEESATAGSGGRELTDTPPENAPLTDVLGFLFPKSGGPAGELEEWAGGKPPKAEEEAAELQDAPGHQARGWNGEQKKPSVAKKDGSPAEEQRNHAAPKAGGLAVTHRLMSTITVLRAQTPPKPCPDPPSGHLKA